MSIDEITQPEEAVEASKDQDDQKKERYDLGADIHDDVVNSTNKPSAFSEAWTSTLVKIRKPIISILLSMSGVSARRPKTVIVSCIVASLSLLGLGFFTNFHVITDVTVLWTPTPSRVRSHGTWVEKEDHGFLEQPRPIYTTLHANGENVLTNAQETVKRLFTIFDTIQNTEGYDDICKDAELVMKDDSNGDNTCLILSPIKFWNYSYPLYESSVTSDQDVIEILSQTVWPDETPVNELTLLGNPTRGDDEIIISTKMLLSYVYLPQGDETLDLETTITQNVLDLREQWEKESDNMLRLEFLTDRSFDDEFERSIVNDIPLVPMIFVVMSGFTCLVFFRRSWVHSRSILGIGAVFTVLLSIICGYGLLFICNVPFTQMAQILPFIMFGIGLDDAFILWGAYQRTDPLKNTEERIHDSIEDVGVSIFVTTFTSILAFTLGGIFSSIPAIYWLCCYAAPTIAIDFILQVTFFVSLIALDERRVKDRRRDILCCLSAPPSSSENVGAEDYSDSIFGKFMIWFSHLLMKPIAKVVVIVSFAGMFGGLGYSATKLKQEFRFADVLPNPSYVQDYLSTYDKYTIGSFSSPFVLFRDVNQSVPEIQDQMEQYINDLVDMSTVNYEPSFFWLRDFKNYLNASNDASLHSAPFPDQLDSFLAVPSFSKLYNDDIVRDVDGNIILSRTWFLMDNVDIEDVTSQVSALEEVLDVSESQSINENRKDWAFFTFDNLYYVWMTFTVIPDELLLSIIVGVSAVTVVTLIFIPHWTSTLFVAPIMSMLCIDLLGFLQLCGIPINGVCYIAIVMSIGLMVDFLLHILLRFYESKELTRTKKVKDVVSTMGTSVLIGGISTFLGVIPLAFASSDIFSTLFYTFLGLVTLGCAHGLILLPVLLSLLGPNIVLDL